VEKKQTKKIGITAINA